MLTKIFSNVIASKHYVIAGFEEARLSHEYCRKYEINYRGQPESQEGKILDSVTETVFYEANKRTINDILKVLEEIFEVRFNKDVFPKDESLYINLSVDSMPMQDKFCVPKMLTIQISWLSEPRRSYDKIVKVKEEQRSEILKYMMENISDVCK